MTTINGERNYTELKKSIKMMKSQRIDTKTINLIEEGKKIGTDKVIKQNQFINKCLNSQI